MKEEMKLTTAFRYWLEEEVKRERDGLSGKIVIREASEEEEGGE